MLGDEHSADRDRLNRAQEEARQRQGEQVVCVVPSNRRQPRVWQTLWNLAEQFYAPRVQSENRSSGDAADNNEQCDRLVPEEDLAADKKGKCGDSDQEGRQVGLANVFDEVPAPFPE